MLERLATACCPSPRGPVTHLQVNSPSEGCTASVTTRPVLREGKLYGRVAMCFVLPFGWEKKIQPIITCAHMGTQCFAPKNLVSSHASGDAGCWDRAEKKILTLFLRRLRNTDGCQEQNQTLAQWDKEPVLSQILKAARCRQASLGSSK